MANSAGETVGDMIVRIRLETMRDSPHRADEIRARFTPRSLQYRRWPLPASQVSA